MKTLLFVQAPHENPRRLRPAVRRGLRAAWRNSAPDSGTIVNWSLALFVSIVNLSFVLTIVNLSIACSSRS